SKRSLWEPLLRSIPERQPVTDVVLDRELVLLPRPVCQWVDDGDTCIAYALVQHLEVGRFDVQGRRGDAPQAFSDGLVVGIAEVVARQLEHDPGAPPVEGAVVARRLAAVERETENARVELEGGLHVRNPNGGDDAPATVLGHTPMVARHAP